MERVSVDEKRGPSGSNSEDGGERSSRVRVQGAVMTGAWDGSERTLNAGLGIEGMAMGGVIPPPMVQEEAVIVAASPEPEKVEVLQPEPAPEPETIPKPEQAPTPIPTPPPPPADPEPESEPEPEQARQYVRPLPGALLPSRWHRLPNEHFDELDKYRTFSPSPVPSDFGSAVSTNFRHHHTELRGGDITSTPPASDPTTAVTSPSPSPVPRDPTPPQKQPTPPPLKETTPTPSPARDPTPPPKESNPLPPPCESTPAPVPALSQPSPDPETPIKISSPPPVPTPPASISSKVEITKARSISPRTSAHRNSSSSRRRPGSSNRSQTQPVPMAAPMAPIAGYHPTGVGISVGVGKGFGGGYAAMAGFGAPPPPPPGPQFPPQVQYPAVMGMAGGMGMGERGMHIPIPPSGYGPPLGPMMVQQPTPPGMVGGEWQRDSFEGTGAGGDYFSVNPARRGNALGTPGGYLPETPPAEDRLVRVEAPVEKHRGRREGSGNRHSEGMTPRESQTRRTESGSRMRREERYRRERGRQGRSTSSGPGVEITITRTTTTRRRSANRAITAPAPLTLAAAPEPTTSTALTLPPAAPSLPTPASLSLPATPETTARLAALAQYAPTVLLDDSLPPAAFSLASDLIQRISRLTGRLSLRCTNFTGDNGWDNLSHGDVVGKLGSVKAGVPVGGPGRVAAGLGEKVLSRLKTGEASLVILVVGGEVGRGEAREVARGLRKVGQEVKVVVFRVGGGGAGKRFCERLVREECEGVGVVDEEMGAVWRRLQKGGGEGGEGGKKNEWILEKLGEKVGFGA